MEELVGSEEEGELAGLVERSLGVLSGLRREMTGSRQRILAGEKTNNEVKLSFSLSAGLVKVQLEIIGEIS